MEIIAGAEELGDVAGVRAHAEKHGDGFVNRAGGELLQPRIANAPGSEGGDGKRKGAGKLLRISLSSLA